MVDLIKSQLLPAWPFSSVKLRYQQQWLLHEAPVALNVVTRYAALRISTR
jgi:hypothetical protein